jgi:hypothetical protein
MKRFGLINAVLLLLILLAAWRTEEVWRRGAPDASPSADPAGKPVGDGLPPPARKPQLPQMVSVIADKDLFDASRKAPEAAAPAPAATPVPPPPTLKLSGVVVVGSQREAVLLDMAQNNKQTRLREGEEISGYKVGKIEPEQISLVGGGGEEIILALQIDKTKAGQKKGFGPAGKPAPPPPPGARVAGQQPPPAPPRPPGGFAPAPENAASAEVRKRADSARERLKRLRSEAGQQ